MTTEVCEPLQKLTSVKTELWNSMYQGLYHKAKNIIWKGVCMKFYDVSKPLYPGDRCLQYQSGCWPVRGKGWH